MQMKTISDVGFVATAMVLFASPALAGGPVPAPIAGVGIVGFIAVSAGYRFLRKRIDR